MSAAQRQLFLGTVNELATLLSGPDASRVLAERFRRLWGQSPSSSESRSWIQSLPALASMLLRGGFGSYPIAIEYQLPPGAFRCDAILFGSRNSKLVVHVIELKQWAAASVAIPVHSRDSVKVLGKPRPHPSYQAANYALKLQHFHSSAGEMEVSASVLMLNCTAQEVADSLGAPCFDEVVRRAPLFVRDAEEAFHPYLRARVGTPPDWSRIETFLEGEYRPSEDFIELLDKHGAAIKADVSYTLLDRGWGLFEDQERVESDVLGLVRENKERFVLVEGAAGAGKTVIAVRLLLKALREGRRALLTTTNGKLYSVLVRILNRSLPGGSGAIALANSLPQRNHRFDLIICDEGQRLTEPQLGAILDRAPLVVVFFDEKQKLLPRELGDRPALLEQAVSRSRRCAEFQLSGFHRTTGGEAYDRWVTSFLSTPAGFGISFGSQTTDYTLRMFESLSQMRQALGQVREEEAANVCLLAALTESDGVTERLRFADPPLNWVMEGSEYCDFWIDQMSNDLSMCSSVYGCQSFERDYAGVVWGRDLVVRGRQWTLHPEYERTIKDETGSPTLVQVARDRKRPWETIELLKNRYRVFLTRGKRGTFLFFEDDETRAFVGAHWRELV